MSVPVFQWRKHLRGHLTATQHHVALHLSDWMDPDGTNAYPTTETLAESMGRKRQTVEKALAELVEAGWLGRHRPSRRKAYRYWTSIPSWYPPGATESPPDGNDSEGRDGPPEDLSWSPSGSELVPSGHRVGTERDHDLPIDLPIDLPTYPDLRNDILTALAGRMDGFGLWARLKTESGSPAEKFDAAIDEAASRSVEPQELVEAVASTKDSFSTAKHLTSTLAHRIRLVIPQLEGTYRLGKFDGVALGGSFACRWCERTRDEHNPEVCARDRREVAR